MTEEITKFVPRKDKKYIVTDQCFWETLTESEQKAYNPYDKNRKPHSVTLVEAETGTTVNLPSGSVIQIISTPYENHK